MDSKELDKLLHAKVCAVVFVLDYLQIQFDNSVATFLEFPKAVVQDRIHSYGETNYRNILCDFIGSAVSSIDYRKDESFVLTFDKGSIFISLAPEEYSSPEMVTLEIEGKTVVM